MRPFLIAVFSLLPFPLQADAALVHSLVVERLGYMEAVAIWKWNEGVAVEDLDRETVVLERSVADAVDAGLPQDEIARFFAAQIAAAKAVQFCWIDRFRTGVAEPDPNPPDLVQDVRPALLSLGGQIIAALSESVRDPALGDPEELSVTADKLDCLDAWHLQALSDSLSGIPSD